MHESFDVCIYIYTCACKGFSSGYCGSLTRSNYSIKIVLKTIKRVVLNLRNSALCTPSGKRCTEKTLILKRNPLRTYRRCDRTPSSRNLVARRLYSYNFFFSSARKTFLVRFRVDGHKIGDDFPLLECRTLLFRFVANFFPRRYVRTNNIFIYIYIYSTNEIVEYLRSAQIIRATSPEWLISFRPVRSLNASFKDSK